MPDNKNVSTQAIADGIENLKKEFIATLDEQTEEAINTYTQMQSQGILSSANIDSITSEIKAKVTELQNDFDDLANKLKQSMLQSQEGIESQRHDIENQLSNGTY